MAPPASITPRLAVATRRAPGPGPLLSAALAAGLLAPLAAAAIPRLDLKPYAPPAAGERRWVIQLPGVLRPSPDPALSPNPADWRVELLVGRTVQVDCNQHRLSGRLKAETVPGWGTSVYRAIDVGPLVSTRRACPPGERLRQAFVPLGSKPFVVPYNASLPIVLYTPKDLEVRWRLWKAEAVQRPAQQL
jgi:ecotin